MNAFKFISVTIISLIVAFALYPVTELGDSDALKQITPIELADKLYLASVVVTTLNASDTTGGNISSQGSGFVISSDGYIITNSHVIADSELIMVWIKFEGTDYVNYPAELIIQDPIADLAILKVAIATPNFLHLAPAGTQLKRGEFAACMSTPYGLVGTFTTGIISALRPNDKLTHRIQTTVPVSPGSSGSALVNSYAEVVGVVIGVLNQGRAQSMNVAVSVDEVHRLIKESKLKIK